MAWRLQKKLIPTASRMYTIAENAEQTAAVDRGQIGFVSQNLRRIAWPCPIVGFSAADPTADSFAHCVFRPQSRRPVGSVVAFLTIRTGPCRNSETRPEVVFEQNVVYVSRKGPE